MCTGKKVTLKIALGKYDATKPALLREAQQTIAKHV